MAAQITQPALERAIANDELVMYYQPKVSLISGEVIGAEALVRWNDPEGDIVPPDVFMPLAEQLGLLHDLTIKLLDLVVDAVGQVRKACPGMAISMNVAPNDLESNIISQRIEHYLKNGRIEASELQIEITESAAMGNVEQIQEDLIKLNKLGIHVLMDDFGTGYSSIDRLSQLPFSSLKLDQGVVRRMGTSRQNLNVVKSSISMARELRMTSVAEGIESAAAYYFLMANGCEEGQGFFIGRPTALDEFISFACAEHQFEGSQIGCVHQAINNVQYLRKCLVDVLYCRSLGAAGVLPSIVDPDIKMPVEESRVGQWYFGVGQHLNGIAEFDSLESDLRALHRFSDELQQAAPEAAEEQIVQKTLNSLDLLSNRVVSKLYSLESALLLRVS